MDSDDDPWVTRPPNDEPWLICPTDGPCLLHPNSESCVALLELDASCLYSCDPNNVYTAHVDYISFGELDWNMRQLREQLDLCLATESLGEGLASQEKSRRDCQYEIRKLLQRIERLGLDVLWFSAAELRRAEIQWKDGHFSWRSYLPEQYSEEFRSAQSRLNELSAHGDLLHTNVQNIKEQLEELLPLIDRMEEEQRELEQRQFERHMERLERFIRDVTIRLQMFVLLLLLFCKFSGISDNDQPVCMTMPWNIRPALIVLWGVCWMFYTPEGYVDPTDTQDAGLDGNMDFSMIAWSPWINNELYPFSNLDPYLDNQDLIAQQPMLPAATEDSTLLFTHESFVDQALDTEFLNRGLYKEGPGRSAALDPKQELGSLDLPSNLEALPKFQTIGYYSPDLNNRQLAGLQPGPVPSASPATDRPNVHDKQSTSPSQLISGSEQPQQPEPHCAEVSMACEHSQCSGLMFNHLSDWK